MNEYLFSYLGETVLISKETLQTVLKCNVTVATIKTATDKTSSVAGERWSLKIPIIMLRIR